MKPLIDLNKYTKCRVLGCVNKLLYKNIGLCKTHYYQLRNGKVAEDHERRCEFEGCLIIHYGKGFCQAHYMAHRGMIKSNEVLNALAKD